MSEPKKEVFEWPNEPYNVVPLKTERRKDWKKPGAAPEGPAPVLPQEAPEYDLSDLTRVPGVVGELVDWMEQSALYPNRPLALGAALATVGTLSGQRVAGPTRTGTHLYYLGIAGTGSGKQGAMDGGKEAMRAAGASERVGPDDFKSSVGFINFIKRKNCFVSFIDEYGLFLQRIFGKSAGGHEQDMARVLQSFWGTNWTFYDSPEAAHEKSEKIFAPAASVYGLTTLETFYSALSGKHVSGGFLNRHLVLRGLDKPAMKTREAGSWDCPPGLTSRLRALYRPRKVPVLEKSMASIGTVEKFEAEIVLGWGPGAEKIWQDLGTFLRDEPDDTRRNLFTRVPEIAVRLATIVAFGRGASAVEEPDMIWARGLALAGAEALHEGVQKHMYDTQEFPALCNTILKYIENAGGEIAHSVLFKKCKRLVKKGSDVKGALDYMIESDEISKVQVLAGGRPATHYRLVK